LDFLFALQFLTSIPVSLRREPAPGQLGRAVAYFPAVGLVIGIVLAALCWLLSFILSPEIVNILLVIALVIITGALHLDGFADTCDGVAGHKPVEERWKVMRDSRTGAFGVVGIVLLLLAKYISLDNVPLEIVLPVLVFMPVVSRWAMVYAIFAFPPARLEGLGASFKSGTRWPQFAIATIITFAVAAALFPLFSFLGFVLIAGIWIIATLLSFYFKHKFAGLTGDTYGAINEISEVMALVLTVLIDSVTGIGTLL